MKPDNIMGNMANPQSWNKYSYVIGNPVNKNDPTGHWYSTGPRDSGGGYAEDMFNPQLDASWVGAARSYQILDTLPLRVGAGPSQGFGSHWRSSSFDPVIAKYLQQQVVIEKGEVAASIWKVSDNLTAFWWTADPEQIRVMDRNYSMIVAEQKGGKLGSPAIGWEWTHLVHVHPPTDYRPGGSIYYLHDDSYGRLPHNESHYFPPGPGPGDKGAAATLLAGLYGHHVSIGVVDSALQYWEYVP